jgi:hypothetical protein
MEKCLQLTEELIMQNTGFFMRQIGWSGYSSGLTLKSVWFDLSLELEYPYCGFCDFLQFL